MLVHLGTDPTGCSPAPPSRDPPLQLLFLHTGSNEREKVSQLGIFRGRTHGKDIVTCRSGREGGGWWRVGTWEVV